MKQVVSFTDVSHSLPFRQVVHLVSAGTLSLMRGSKRKLKENYWLLRIDRGRDPVSGKRIQASRTVRGTSRQAELALDEFRAETQASGSPLPSMTLCELAERWMTTPTKGGRKRSSVGVYNTRLRFNRYVAPKFGNRQIGEIRSSEITLLLDDLMARHGLSARTVSHVHSELRAMLNWAWRRDLLKENPALRVDVPSVPLKGPTSLTCEELCEHLRVVAGENEDLELVMMIAASLGLRRSEIAALKWSHIDFNKSVLHVREGVTKAPGSDYETTPTKTGLHGFADFPLHPGLVERLQIRRKAFRDRLKELGEVQIADGYVFTNDPLGQAPFHPDTLTSAFRKHSERHPELPPIGLQILRRYAASDLFAEGEDQVIAAAILRDTPETTARHYRAVNREKARTVVLDIYQRIETRRDSMDREEDSVLG